MEEQPSDEHARILERIQRDADKAVQEAERKDAKAANKGAAKTR